ncbi:SurA N-terminal domain-containing protein [Guptibacillus algicola]|uniref:SurA N-terminal domain-containing protein n=1 Tax=Guptibacillus algicola TaxID=225844 RepID=UPI001CD69246|nr:SurA N-terminal domain-containing protein [Alkalihalobacillus algicola]MCA0986758.1 SurA N-terminal domain-containing protein [Alkalihalobacillus algicola]
MRKLTYLMITGLLLVALAACGGNEESESKNKENDTEQKSAEAGEGDSKQSQPDVDEVKADKVVATVNGEEIKGEDFNALYTQNQMQYHQMGQEVSEEQLSEIKKQVAESMVGQELILQAANEKGYEASEKQVEEELADLKEQYGDEKKFETALEESGMTLDELKKEIGKNVQYTSYVEEEIRVEEVTEEEMKQYYDQAKEKGSSEEMPAFEEVKSQIKKGLESEKKKKKTQEHIEKLKEDADIKINV